jgi:hypothetical protein
VGFVALRFGAEVSEAELSSLYLGAEVAVWRVDLLVTAILVVVCTVVVVCRSRIALELCGSRSYVIGSDQTHANALRPYTALQLFFDRLQLVVRKILVV